MATTGQEAERPTLRLDDLSKGYPGLSPQRGAALCQAAAVCLEHVGHTSGATLNVDGSYHESFRLLWPSAAEQFRRTWADMQDATEHGAYGVALAVMDALTGLVAVQRAVKGTGFDYWLAPVGAGGPLFQGTTRLEVSGVLVGDRSVVRQRVREKVEQTKVSDGKLAAFVVVVEFGEPKSVVVKR